MRVKIKEGTPFRFIIKNPQKKEGRGSRRSFKIEKRNYNLQTKQYINSETPQFTEDQASALVSINLRFKDKQIDFAEARKAVESLIDEMYRDARVYQAIVFNEDNRKILKRYLEECYPSERYQGENKQTYISASYESGRAVEALGEVSLETGSPKSIQKAVDKYCQGDANKQRRVIFKLRGILAWLRPGERWTDNLHAEDYERKTVKYLTEDEYKEVRKHLPNELYQIAADVCFYTGCRIGEAIALTPADYRERTDVVTVVKQITRQGHEERKVKNKTKNKKNRHTIIFKNGIKSLKRWFEIKRELDLPMRDHLARVLSNACRKVYPNDPDKHLKWHDLRHCYAIMCLDKGCTIDDVADLIGDSVVVAKEHYVGYIIADNRMSGIRDKLGNS